ncbi:hypothetical protein SAMN05216368_101430 [Cryobacterium flavum]|uniref:Uncharacterized protein n=1 Tax=Cryobacterium flavum TaxID=1424659 RepID=A0A4R8V520_9MICO|nr:hypothetical protein [Cryobacterium flavum]TFB77806.1 hypothetical protein E3O21_09190 [Cryobacterium flavum]SDM60806.1 hypothetical protein SAMN05216368_101430 [Cryobacterium flavum]
MFSDLQTWSTRRWIITAAAAAAAFIAFATGYAPRADDADGALWWTVAATALGASLIGLIVASYVGTPIGADATLCDTRWPALGLIALYLTTEVRSLDPIVSGAARPALAAAALALLIWALRERLVSERRATTRRESSESAEGDVCTTCMPLFPRSRKVGPRPITLPPTPRTGQDTQP